MPIERVVVDASPLIILFKGQLEQLLPKLFNEIIVPAAVWEEVTDSKEDIAARALPTTSWVKRLELSEISGEIFAWGLGAGESEVLSYAFNHHQYWAIVDDKAARRCAKTLRIRTLGTGGLLVLAKRRGVIPSIIPALKAIECAGLWLSQDVIKLLMQQAGEDD
ncbi:DUF3368 domain-containing protein [Acaryochloris sp. CCMEE 5410]|nr:DUF3368 domain-containing protein [Acaryochloris sp. CCMEE 5410]